MSSRPSTAAGSLQDGGYQLRDLTGHKQPVSVVAWASNGRRLASGSDDGTVRLWNVEHQPPSRPEKAEHELQHGSREAISALAFHPRREELLAVIGSHVTKVYDLRSKSSAAAVWQCSTPDAIAASWDGHDGLLVAQLNNTLTLMEPRRKRNHKPRHLRDGDELTGLLFVDGSRKLLLSTRHGVEVYAWPSYEHLCTLTGHAVHHGRDGGVTAMAVSSKDKLLASGGSDGLVLLWDIASGTPMSAACQPDNTLRALSISCDHQLLAMCAHTPAVGQPCGLDIISIASGRVAAHVPLSQHTESVVFNPRYPRLLAYAGEPVPQGYRDKGREVVAGKVCILNIGAK